MSHDPCIECGDGTFDKREILLDGDAPCVTVCSYACLEDFAHRKNNEI